MGTYVGKVVSHHTRGEACLEDFSSTCPLSGEATRLGFELRRDTSLLVITEPCSHTRPIWQIKDHERRTENGDDTFDDEKPSKAFETAYTVHEPHSVPDAATKRTSERRRRENKGNS